jgi:hypothetical protein
MAGSLKTPSATVVAISNCCMSTWRKMTWSPGWEPGPGRDPVPGTQEALGELIRAWIDSGAECP